MSSPVISVRGLGKKYRIGGASKPYRTLRESITDTALAPFRRLTRSDQTSPAPTGPNSFWALKDVSFDVFPGEVVGIIGRNGAGKSTLLKVLSRITDPTEGEVELRGRVGSLLEVGTGFHPELTGRENIYLNGAILGMGRGEISKKFDEIIAFAETERFLDTPVKFYSSGMYTRLAFAVAAHLEPEILIVDEVLAVGDAEFQKKCLGKMSEVADEGRTVVFVSHNMGAVVQLCSRAVILAAGRVTQVGDVNAAVASYLSHHAERSGHADLRDFPTRKGSGAVRFEAVRVLNSAGETASEYNLGDDLTIEFDIQVLRPVGTLTFGVELSASDGLKLANMADFDSGFELESPRQRETLRVRLSDLRLYPDRYFIGLFVGSSHGRDWYDWCEECLQFEIVGGGRLTTRPLPRSSGLLFLTPSWERVDSAASSAVPALGTAL